MDRTPEVGAQVNDWDKVTKSEPCVACGKPDWCRRTGDGAIFCKRATAPPDGYELGPQRPTGRIFFAIDRVTRWPFASRTHSQTPARPAIPERDFDAELASIRSRGASLEPWAAELGVPVESLRALEAVELTRADMDRLRIGFKDDAKPDRALGWPERDGADCVVSIGARAANGAKGCAARASRGLVAPVDLAALPGPVVVVEGFSDVAALRAVGVPAVGRPSNMGGAKLLAEALAVRDVIVMGENDCKPHGVWPGRDGAASVAKSLAKEWNRTVPWAFPPDELKDARVWLAARVAGGLDLRDSSARLAAGRDFLAAVVPSGKASASLAKPRLLVNGSELEAKPIEWLWQPVLPLGQVALLAGHPDVGKSTLALEIAARVTRGEALPFASHPPVDGSVLVVSAEDDLERTVKPRFLAAGGNASRFHAATDAALELGNVAAILEALEPELPADLRFIVADTLTSLADGIDLNSNAEVRSLYRRLKAFASRHRCTVLILAHFSKAEGRSPLARISGSVAIGSTPRSAWVAIRDPEDETQVLLLKAKMNLTRVTTGFRYRLVDAPVAGAGSHPRIEWESTAEPRSAAELLRQSEQPTADTEKTKSALAWLDELIPPGTSMSSAEVHTARKSARHSERAALEASRRLRIDTRYRPGGLRGPCYWRRESRVPDLTSRSDGNGVSDREESPTAGVLSVPGVPVTIATSAVPVTDLAATSPASSEGSTNHDAQFDGNDAENEPRRERGERCECDVLGDSTEDDARSLRSAKTVGNDADDDPDAPWSWVEGEPR